MKKFIIIALTSMSILGLNAQGKGKVQKELKKVEQIGNEKLEHHKGKKDHSDQKIEKSKDKFDKSNGKASDKLNKSNGKAIDKLDKSNGKAVDKLDKSSNKAIEKLDKSKGKLEKEGDKRIKDKSDKLKDHETELEDFDHDDKDLDGKEIKGKAHGKDKGELSGNEFGKERAIKAKENNLVKKEKLTNSVSDAENKLTAGNAKVAAAKLKLEADKAAGSISVEEYTEKASKIMQAEAALKSLSEKVTKSKLID